MSVTNNKNMSWVSMEKPEPIAARNSSSDSDGWVVSYADILLLLLTFFILLFAFSRVGGTDMRETESGQSETLSEAKQERTTQTARLEYELEQVAPESLLESPPIDRPVRQLMVVASSTGTNFVEQVKETSDRTSDEENSEDIVTGLNVDAETLDLAEQEENLDLVYEIEQDINNSIASEADFSESENTTAHIMPYSIEAEYIEAEHIATHFPEENHIAQQHTVGLTIDEQLARLSAGLTSDEIELTSGYQSINIELNNKVLFSLGEANLLAEGQQFLNEIVDIMQGNEYYASIEGHTDNSPISTARFPSNWELSSARANSVARYLIEQGINAQRLRTIGYADTKPKVDNNSEEGRAVNRRVSIMFHFDEDTPVT